MAAYLASYCPATLYAGECTTQGCKLQHDVKLCETCGVICAPRGIYRSHIRGRRHRELTANADNIVTYPFCLICERNLDNNNNWKAHISSASHRKAASRQGLSANVELPTAAQLAHRAQHCPLCNVTVLKDRWPQHLGNAEHKKREAIAAHKGAFEQAEQDKEGVAVVPDGDIDFGVIKPDESRQGVHKVVVIHLSAGSPSAIVEKVTVFDRANRVSSSFQAQLAGDGRLVDGQDVQLRLSLVQANYGQYDSHLELRFRRHSSNRQFVIVRSVHAVVGDHGDRELLKAATPYVAKKRVPWRNGQSYYPGRRPPALDAVPWVRKLKMYPIPPALAAAFRDTSADDLTQIIRTRFLPKAFNTSTHVIHFRTLLWTEEWRMENDLRRYDIEGVTFVKDGAFY
ncbi:uncharacterized protein C8Q71DRAFT_113656 [Rhodofomes roseus]|uniref:U1-type domain-containing protein n=1 Tax=Rhodofomes roseus TaxID=34475 RepID=A0ABQ8KDX5_9APHY|nr:uncharacterized protein C8Q71DRAFT_113656 [Rhodofomes roseus]KAH9835324.1 hypothetical protein C8Q71DRAFT_113656 [Rhodofomes roseus]